MAKGSEGLARGRVLRCAGAVDQILRRPVTGLDRLLAAELERKAEHGERAASLVQP